MAAHRTPRISQAQGLAYLASVQRPDGGFDSFSSPAVAPFEKVFTYRTTFVPSLVLGALSVVPTPASWRVREHLAAFVRAQRSPLWSYNYWARNAPERQRQPYPDDLDDTCCALIGLTLHDAPGLEPAALAAAVKLLLATETQPGGPYRTWLVPPGGSPVWHDVDLAVNANVNCLLSLISEPLPNVTALLEQAIRTRQLTSPYYPSSRPIMYYLARAYRGALTGNLTALARRLLTTVSQTPLDQALLLSSLVRLGEHSAAAGLAGQLLAAQNQDGSWPAAAFCLDPARSGRRYYHGSESLTTAFAVEALQLYSEISDGVDGQSETGINRREQTFTAQVLVDARRECRQLRPELRTATIDFLGRVLASDTGPDIVALPWRFNQSLARPLGSAFRPLLKRLALANLYGWTAYTIYDDFLDEEGTPALLPVATTALRYSLAAFDQVLPEADDFRRVARQTFDIIDSANAWELSHCRCRCRDGRLLIGPLPDYGDAAGLANRSLGHSLTPLAILRAGGAGPQTKLFRGVRQAMIHYLAARQLNDDAHDWPTDLQNGQLTYVVSRLLAEEGIKPGTYDADKLVRRLRRRFWRQTLPDICRLMERQTELARHSLNELPGLERHNVITHLLDDIDASLTETLAAQDQAAVFLKHYRSGRPAVR